MTPIEDIPGIVDTVREGQTSGVLRSIEARRTQLKQMRRLILENEAAFTEALQADFGKPPTETYGTEIAFTVAEIDHTLKHLDAWNKPTKVKVPLTFKPGHAQLVPEPLGTVLVIAPWNYPVQLLYAPAIPALAAGNAVVLKPSEVTEHVSALIADLTPKYLDSRVVQVVTGGVDETTVLLQQRWDHIFYTGNGTVGRIVMEAAAKHLTPVTLELGGKSPVIVAADADIDVAARRIAWGKFVNAGQTCVAPDYVLVDEAVEDKLLGALLRTVHDFYGDSPKHSDDFARIVSSRQFERIAGLLDAGGFDATVCGGERDAATRYIAPTVLAGVKPDAAIMQQEIFGPVLPVLTVGNVDEAIDFVNARDKPLALYVFSDDEATVDRVISHTSAGGVCVNQVLMHLALADLPFGGVGPSGMGAYHGKAGFDTFTHHKPVLQKPTRPDPPVMYPPYKSWKQKLLRKVM
jgi:aldehyde dehydrogenase (NAD+)